MSERLGLEVLNAAAEPQARASLLACLDVPRWAEEVLAGRPYPDVDALLTAAGAAAEPLTPEEVTGALSRHPRIGERPGGGDAEARMSRSEQSGVDTADADVVRRLRDGNAAYEDRFGHVFLIRAAGRDAPEILAALEERLRNDPGTELTVVARELRQIALLRLEGMVRP